MKLVKISILPAELNASRSGWRAAPDEGEQTTRALVEIPPHPLLRSTLSLQGEGTHTSKLAPND